MVSSTTIQRVLQDFHYTMKSIVSVPELRNDERTLNLREEYATKFRHLESTSEHKNFIFLVEVEFSVVSCQRRGRLRQGTSAYVTVSAAKSQNISVIAAMNKYGTIFYKVYKAVTGEDFKQCFIELKAATVSAGIENPIYIYIYLIMLIIMDYKKLSIN